MWKCHWAIDIKLWTEHFKAHVFEILLYTGCIPVFTMTIIMRMSFAIEKLLKRFARIGEREWGILVGSQNDNCLRRTRVWKVGIV